MLFDGREVGCGFTGTYLDGKVEVEGTALVGKTCLQPFSVTAASQHLWPRETRARSQVSQAIYQPGRVVAFNTAEYWAEDAWEDIAREIKRPRHIASSVAALRSLNIPIGRTLPIPSMIVLEHSWKTHYCQCRYRLLC
jgi:hypothetical protein